MGMCIAQQMKEIIFMIMNYDQDHKYTNSHTHINGMAIKLWYQVSSILIDSQYLDFLIKYNLAPQISMDIYIFYRKSGA